MLAISSGVPLSPDFVSPHMIICHMISLFNWANLSSDYKQFVLHDIIQIVKVPTCTFCLKCIAYKLYISTLWRAQQQRNFQESCPYIETYEPIK